MHGGIYTCDKCGYAIGHYGSDTTNRVACISCEGWMYPTEEPSNYSYKKPNIIWVGIAHVIWFFLKPIDRWLERHTYDDHE
jgi:predicted RNA-binding Zn-ribbon protein involved in translation (DUF1610 family)